MSEEKKMSMGDMLADVKAVESNLARQENQDLEAIALRFPEDHPVREEYVKMMASAGDLGNLPVNHPFILTLKDIKRQVDAAENPEVAEQQQEESRERSSERRQKQRHEQQETRVRDEEDRAIRRMAASQVNSQLAKVDKEVNDLHATLEGVKPDLAGDPYTYAKVMRLERMMSMMKRTLSECKFNNTRMM